MRENIAHRFKKRWATAEKTLPMIFQNHGQRFLKRWAMFFKTTGNEIYRYGMCWIKSITVGVSKAVRIPLSVSPRLAYAPTNWSRSMAAEVPMA